MSADAWDWYDDHGWETRPDAHRVVFEEEKPMTRVGALTPDQIPEVACWPDPGPRQSPSRWRSGPDCPPPPATCGDTWERGDERLVLTRDGWVASCPAAALHVRFGTGRPGEPERGSEGLETGREAANG